MNDTIIATMQEEDAIAELEKQKYKFPVLVDYKFGDSTGIFSSQGVMHVFKLTWEDGKLIMKVK